MKMNWWFQTLKRCMQLLLAVAHSPTAIFMHALIHSWPLALHLYSIMYNIWLHLTLCDRYFWNDCNISTNVSLSSDIVRGFPGFCFGNLSFTQQCDLTAVNVAEHWKSASSFLESLKQLTEGFLLFYFCKQQEAFKVGQCWKFTVPKEQSPLYLLLWWEWCVHQSWACMSC